MNLPSVSIIVPVYNVASYIIECLQSVAHQTYSGKIECLVVDDCGTDESIELAKQFISENKGPVDFKIVSRLSNGGLSEARNTGVRAATGEYLYFLDSDDFLDENAILSIVETLNSFPQAETVFSESVRLIDGEKTHPTKYNENLVYLDKDDLGSFDIYKEGNISVTAWNKLVKTQWFIEKDLFFKKSRISEDLIWTFGLLAMKPSIAYNHNITYMYRLRAGSILTSLKNDAKLKKMIESLMQNYEDMVFLCKRFCVKNKSMLNYVFWSQKNIFKTALDNGVSVHYLFSVFKDIKLLDRLDLRLASPRQVFFQICLALPSLVGFVFCLFFMKISSLRK